MQPLGTLPRLTTRHVRSHQQFGRHSMRIYALLLGITLTSGYGAAAELAVSSLDAGRQTRAHTAATIPASDAPGAVWYGGVRDPITVVSSPGDSQTAARALIFSRPTVRCVGAARSTVRTIS